MHAQVSVWDKATLSDKVLSTRLSWRARTHDDLLGRASVEVAAAAAAAAQGRLRVLLPLQDALQGEVELLLEWLPGQLLEG